MWEHYLTEKELELVEILKQKELTKGEALKLGYQLTRVFLMKCENHGILVYESDDENQKKKYGVVK